MSENSVNAAFEITGQTAMGGTLSRNGILPALSL